MQPIIFRQASSPGHRRELST